MEVAKDNEKSIENLFQNGDGSYTNKTMTEELVVALEASGTPNSTKSVSTIPSSEVSPSLGVGGRVPPGCP